eukprot:g4317.t1
MIPPAHSRMLHARAEKSRLRRNVVFPDGQHNDTWEKGGDEYWKVQATFLQECLAQDGAKARPKIEEAFLAKRQARGMVQHVWQNYEARAFGKDELKPVSGRGVDSWGGVGQTLVDSMDTLWMMGFYEEFHRAATWAETQLDFDKDLNVNYFETSIRHLGGLLSAYIFSQRPGLLLKAIDLAERLAHAFPKSEAEVVPEEKSRKIARTGSHLSRWLRVWALCRKNGDVHAINDNRISLGSRGDSFYEYLLKDSIFLGTHANPMARAMWASFRAKLPGLLVETPPRTSLKPAWSASTHFCEEICILLNDAYDLLSDPKEKKAYDIELHGANGMPKPVLLLEQDMAPTWEWTSKAGNKKMKPVYNGRPLSRSLHRKVPPEDQGEKWNDEKFVFVDEWTCIACRNCCDVAPRTFCIDADAGRARVFAQWGNSEELLDYAVQACPVDCIYWVSRDELQVLEYVTRDRMFENGNTVPCSMAARQGTGGGLEDPFTMATDFKAKLEEEAERRKRNQQQGEVSASISEMQERIRVLFSNLSERLRTAGWG